MMSETTRRGRWSFIERAIAEIEGGSLPNNLDVIVSDRLETALASTGTDALEELHDKLQPLFLAIHRAIPASMSEALRTDDVPHRLLDLLGAIGFAQMTAARYARRRDDGRMLRAIEDDDNYKLLNALHDDHKLSDLPRKVHLPEDDINRQLIALREIGVVDYRIEGPEATWFLTPMARIVLIEVVREKRTTAGIDKALAVLNRFASDEFEAEMKKGDLGKNVWNMRQVAIDAANGLRSADSARTMHSAFSRPKDERDKPSGPKR